MQLAGCQRVPPRGDFGSHRTKQGALSTRWWSAKYTDAGSAEGSECQPHNSQIGFILHEHLSNFSHKNLQSNRGDRAINWRKLSILHVREILFQILVFVDPILMQCSVTLLTKTYFIYLDYLTFWDIMSCFKLCFVSKTNDVRFCCLRGSTKQMYADILLTCLGAV